MSVEFQDFSMQVKAAIEDATEQFLEEASVEIETQTIRNIDKANAIKTGQLKGSWSHKVDMAAHESKVGSPLENAIWTELGTGEYALGGNGRKGGWVYEDEEGEHHFTRGKRPVRMLFNAFTSSKQKIIRRAEQIFKERMN